MKETILRKLQLAELDILKQFIQVCEKLKLKYFLNSGTLLGCIRHQGFIPWDDDIDVSMPREDYEILINQGQKLLSEKYFIQNYQTDKEFPMNYAKMRNSETTFIESSVKNLAINHGIYIDIFPMDGYDSNAIISNFINWKKYVLYDIQIAKKYTDVNKNTVSLKHKMLYWLSDLLYSKNSINDILIKKEKIAKKHKIVNSNCVCFYCYPDATRVKGCYMLKEYYEKGIMKKFEDIQVRVPENYNEILTKMYGDYMTLPPEEKRITHHYTETIDTEKSYKFYINKE